MTPRECVRKRLLPIRGFTMVELVITMVIIGLLTAIVIPKIDLARFQVEGTMQSVGTLMLAAQRLAVTRQHDVVARFDLTNNTIRLLQDKNDDGLIGANEHVQTVYLGEKVVFGRGFAPARPIGNGPITFTQQTAGQASVTFHRNGSASEEGGFYLTSQRAASGYASGKNDTRAIEVERGTGRVRWFRYITPNWKQGF
jgi:prepilin-type N-terminal cleavage/methylation domain-containing protein